MYQSSVLYDVDCFGLFQVFWLIGSSQQTTAFSFLCQSAALVELMLSLTKGILFLPSCLATVFIAFDESVLFCSNSSALQRFHARTKSPLQGHRENE
jgi:hypothetical protein